MANDDDFFSSTTTHAVSGAHMGEPDGAVDFAAAIASRFGSASMLTAKLPADVPTPAPAPPKNDVPDDFAAAIANRFGSANMLTAKLPASLPKPQQSQSPSPMLRMPSSPMAKLQITNSAPLDITTVRPSDLDSWLFDESTAARTLVVDIRPHAAYANARLPKAVSLSVPSTLLKRPLFSLERLCEMLPTPSARARFSAWKTASRILVYDADSAHIPETSNIFGLLRKFKNDKFAGELAWLQGGFQQVWKERRSVVDDKPPQGTDDPDEEDETSSDDRVLRTKRLPMAAFTLTSTTQNRPKRQGPGRTNLTLSEMHTPSAVAPPPPASSANPFFDNIRQNAELSHGITERIPLRIPRRVRRRINDLPFTWLQEIARRAATLPRAASHPAPRRDAYSSTSESEDDTADEPDPNDVEEGMEALAMQFYRIEVAEQRRMMNIMEHHTRESNTPQASRDSKPDDSDSCVSFSKGDRMFPYSIIAGVEKGSKNRYRNIWPFEHARVRLRGRKRNRKLQSQPSSGHISEHEHSPSREQFAQKTPRATQPLLSLPPSPGGDSDDYVNASHVQPLGTTKRYIATQGPLPDTFADFWTLVWQQNVHVIVMLTREIEGSMIKCGSYWTENSYGPLRLKLVSSTGGSGVESDNIVKPSPQSGGFFTFQPPTPKGVRPRQIKRVFELRHTKYPRAGARKVVQIQYLEWPDMNVPDDPRGVLELIKEVDQCSAQAKAESMSQAAVDNDAQGEESDDSCDPRTGICRDPKGIMMNPPVLLHCSAGVGRTGGFIAVDAVLDGMRRELRKRRNDALVNAGMVLSPMSPTVPLNDRDGDVTMADGVKNSTQASTSVACHRGDMSSATSAAPHDGERDTEHDIEMKNNDEVGATTAGPHVVHVPVATVEQRQVGNFDGWDGHKISPPDLMQVDGEEYHHKKGREGTRRWVEDVTAQTGLGASADEPGAPVGASSASPPSRGSVSNSASAGSSTTSDESSFGFKTNARRARSGSLHGTSSPLTSGDSDAAGQPGRQGGEDGAQRARTSSVPSTLRPKLNGLNGGTLGSSPLATASTPFLGAGQKTPGGFFAVPALPANANPSALSHSTSPGSTDAPSPPTRANSGSGSGTGSGSGSNGSVPPSTDRSFSSPTPASASPHESERRLSEPFSAMNSMDLTMPSTQTSQAQASQEKTAGEKKERKGRHSRRPSMSYVDYKQPRKLHDDASPPPLSSFDDPICEVVQDMREQRMSLCQSLRQYVFVHAAVIEGALMIVDEEREDAQRRGAAMVSQRSIRSLPGGMRGISDELLRRPSSVATTTQRPASSNAQTPRPTLRAMDVSDNSSTTTTSTGKRGASPTELRKEDVRGEVRLSKRPSLKRKAPSQSPGADKEMQVEHPHPRQLYRPPSTGTRLSQVAQGVSSGSQKSGSPSPRSLKSGGHPPP
ncbi:uncharacterized protein SCHCODRAFT_02696170 [Schizophyllum commune H4-8]|uniref:uncharacterized protein n=1 Tax=Schizophyllum commune (strain H4-8 / FGSC 9210) TaxID=578458 RepID=UPI00215EDDF5|nr:uncharacterized protein SCHCODRAFT_02696170 [Schizophyllum commune H4-8]KAI5897482.1 hypothetical protein SCHCODRAFT_02696170 [Schizophyllum commune H4-8]